MTASQRALATALGIVALVVVASVIFIRLNTSAVEISGERVTLTPTLTSFAGVDVAGNWRLDVTRGDAWRVELDVPAGIEDRMTARVVDGVLEIRFDNRLRFGGFGGFGVDYGARITMPELESLTLAGASDVTLSGFAGERLAITSTGAAEIEGRASRYTELELTMTGAGEADLGDVTVTNAELAISGAGEVTLRMAGGRLTGNLSGAGQVDYYGTVSEQSIATSGVGRVEHVD
jgi:hypothetical protein